MNNLYVGLSSVAITASSYAALEVVRHVLVANYLTPFLVNLGLSAQLITVATNVAIVFAVLGIAYLAYKAYRYLVLRNFFTDCIED